MTKKREELQEELVRIEQRCRRPRPPPRDHQNHPRTADVAGGGDAAEEEGVDGSKRRNKFAMEADHKDGDDSDGDADGDEDRTTRDRSKGELPVYCLLVFC